MGDLNGRSEYTATCSPKQKKRQRFNNLYFVRYFSLHDYYSANYLKIFIVMMKFILVNMKTLNT